MLSKWIVNAVPSRVIVADVLVSEFKVGVERKVVVVKDVKVSGTIVVVAEGEVEAWFVAETVLLIIVVAVVAEVVV